MHPCPVFRILGTKLYSPVTDTESLRMTDCNIERLSVLGLQTKMCEIHLAYPS